jgi:hypothetical protein
MADLKISQLTSATLPLAGTEVLPIVQSSSTKKVATDNLTVKNVRSNATTGILQVAGPGASTTRIMTVPDANFTAARTDAAQSFTGDQTLSTGNLIIGTSGKGIDFSATSGTGTSELLDDYEEGTFTARLWDADSGGNSSATTATGYYTKVGNIVSVSIANWNNIDTTGMTAGNIAQIELPFVPERGSAGAIVTDNITYTGGYTSAQAYIAAGSVRGMYISYTASILSDGTAVVSDFLSGVADIVRLQVTYQTAS